MRVFFNIEKNVAVKWNNVEAYRQKTERVLIFGGGFVKQNVANAKLSKQMSWKGKRMFNSHSCKLTVCFSLPF